MSGAQAAMLPDGRRLHLQHGPIDLIIEAWGPERNACYRQATARFQTVLEGLCEELPALRSPKRDADFKDPTAKRMSQAIAPYSGVFVTPMASVAGAVADETLAALTAGRDVPKAYVNNGGDVAFHLTSGQAISAKGPSGDIVIRHEDLARGVATSGWRGRSHSLGIADAVTVAAPSAAAADVAATLIANAVDLPGNAAIERLPAAELCPDSDLGQRLVTTAVRPLTAREVDEALEPGAALARRLIERGLISQAVLLLQGRTQVAGTIKQEIPEHA
ncbi:MAG: UPF0280 family protein [Pseudomonadota bacterium]